MRKLLLLIFFILACKVSSFASHIVGGEFELVYISGNTYRLNLIIYFDEINGNPGAKYDPTPLAWIYRKSDDRAMRQITLPLLSEEKVIYTLPECQNDAVVNTTKMVFSRTITMDPEEYDHPSGYYIVWQRCCRNYNIQNIVSEDPDAGGIGSGQTFYLEIPPLMKNGEHFINTSPQLFPPLSDYACVNRQFYADFTGFDADGDSLVYTMVEPLNTPSPEPHPQPPSTAPYPVVRWEDSYSIGNIVHGSPDLSISQDGLLRVTPTEIGLFVFAVKCEEFRDSEKIGEVRRDFQMVVVGCEPPGNKPEVGIRLADGSSYHEGQVLRFLADDDKCVRFTVADEKGGKVNLKLDPVGYDEDNFTIDILSRSPAGDRLEAEVCFTDCPPTRDLPFEVSFIGLDHTCPQPLQDTVKLTVAITPPDNDLPVLKHKEETTSNYSTSNLRSVEVNEQAGGLKIVELLGEDANSDLMDFMVVPVDFDMDEYGMQIINKKNEEGLLEAWLQWNYDCQQINFDGRNEFELFIYLEDQDDCGYKDPIRLTLNLKVNLPYNSEPSIFSNTLGVNADNYFRIESPLRENISFDVSGADLDGDKAVIEAQAANFNFFNYAISYNGVSGEGGANPTQLSSNFSWPLDCESFNLAQQDSFRIYFYIEDFDKCELTNRDTLTVDFLLSPPGNSIPQLTMIGINGTEIKNDTAAVHIGEPLNVRFTGADFEDDSLYLSLLNNESETLQYTFADASGKGSVRSDLTWDPGCFLLDNQPARDYRLVFRLNDDHCYFPQSDSIVLNVHIMDIDNKSEVFLPPNIFTPNGDEWNNYFGMYRRNFETNEAENILPLDNCSGQFEKVVIFNRWGREVYSSTDRNFKWYGEGLPTGIYYYYIKYSNTKYRGSVTLRF